MSANGRSCLLQLKRILPVNFRHEVFEIFKLAWPLILCHLAEFLIPLITLQFIGQNGATALASMGLGTSFCNVFGLALVLGIDTATTTLCSQSFGARNYHRYGLIIQRTFLMQMCICLAAISLWLSSERLLILMQQDKEISRLASIYILWRIPSFILQAAFATLKSYLVCQQIVRPLIVMWLLALLSCVISNIVLVKVLGFGIIGSGMSINIAYLVVCLLTFGYIRWKKIYKAWPGWSWACLTQWGQFAALAVPGSLMVFFDWGTGEIGVFLAGMLGKVQLGAQSVISGSLGMLFMIPLGISLAAGVNVGKFLGAGEPKKAANSAKSALCLSWGIGLVAGILFLACKDYVGYAFTNSKEVVMLVSKIVPLAAPFHLLDCTQGVAAGIMRGLGLQKFGAVINFIGFDMIGLPLGAVFALVLSWDILGFWAGLTIGMFIQAVLLIIVMSIKSWKIVSAKARTKALSSTVDVSVTTANEGKNPEEDTELVEVDKQLPGSDGENELVSAEPLTEDQDDLQLDAEDSSLDAAKVGNIKVKRVVHIALLILIPGTLIATSLILRIHS